MPMTRPALIRRTKKEKEQGTTPGDEQAPVLHPQPHDREESIDLIVEMSLK